MLTAASTQAFVLLDRPIDGINISTAFLDQKERYKETYGYFGDMHDSRRWSQAGDARCAGDHLGWLRPWRCHRERGVKTGACPCRAALAPFRANKTVGLDNFKWILYGDDDTVFFPQNVLDLVNGLDHNMPYYLTDHLWFPEWKGAAPLAADVACCCRRCSRSCSSICPAPLLHLPAAVPCLDSCLLLIPRLPSAALRPTLPTLPPTPGRLLSRSACTHSRQLLQRMPPLAPATPRPPFPPPEALRPVRAIEPSQRTKGGVAAAVVRARKHTSNRTARGGPLMHQIAGGAGHKDKYVHASRRAPRCLPCNYTDPLEATGVGQRINSFKAVKACPCTMDALCKGADNAGIINSWDCTFTKYRRVTPPTATVLVRCGCRDTGCCGPGLAADARDLPRSPPQHLLSWLAVRAGRGGGCLGTAALGPS